MPSPPEELSVSDITQASCILKWKKPKDDGGMPITKYIIEREDLAVKNRVAVYQLKTTMNRSSFFIFNLNFITFFQVDGIK